MKAATWQDSRLPKILLPRGGLLAILEAYFDESEREGGIFCVAGYVFAPIQAHRFGKDWRRVMGHYWPFRMSELVAGKDKHTRPTKFASLTIDQRNALLRKAIELINHRTMLAISIACNIHDVRRLSPGIKGFRSAYSVCCYLCMMLLGKWIDEQKLHDRVAYVFEAGHAFQKEAEFLMRLCKKHPQLAAFGRYESHAFVAKEDSAALQAADLYAWELGKFLDETVEQRRRDPRKSLKALVNPNPRRHEGRVLSEKSLRKYFAEIGALVLDAEASSASRASRDSAEALS